MQGTLETGEPGNSEATREGAWHLTTLETRNLTTRASSMIARRSLSTRRVLEMMHHRLTDSKIHTSTTDQRLFLSRRWELLADPANQDIGVAGLDVDCSGTGESTIS